MLHITFSPTTWKHCAQAGVVKGTTGNWDGVSPWVTECDSKRHLFQGEARVKNYQIVEQCITVKGLNREAIRRYLAR